VIRNPKTGSAVIKLICVLVLATFSSETLWAQDTASETSSDSAEEVADAATDSLSQAIAKLKAQLDAQTKQLERLQQQYTQEIASRQREKERQDELIQTQASQIDTQRQATQSLQQQVDQIATEAESDISETQKKLRSRLQTVEESIQASQEAESTQYDINSFPGSLRIPGSSAAVKIGGFVRMNIVESFKPIGSTDRFIVSTIPVPQDSAATTSSLTVSQSRLNLELRDVTHGNPLRAFIEGDFAGLGNTFRLRHAFGQFEDLLIGKTWSTFMDAEARPEDLDFEGINGQILVRQAQIRYFPKLGKNWNLLVALEDPKPEIAGGEGESRIPDLVLSVQRTWFKKWHVKSALLYRNIEAICDCLSNPSDNANGWGVSVSGRTAIKWWDTRDSLQFQINYGSGYGRYVNDLANLNNSDAIFDPETGTLHALTVSAFYVAIQKWWAKSLRSNFNVSHVTVDNFDFQPADAYRETVRFSGNIIWSPTARVDVGGELLYGKRQNRDRQSANSLQLQMSATYRY